MKLPTFIQNILSRFTILQIKQPQSESYSESKTESFAPRSRTPAASNATPRQAATARQTVDNANLNWWGMSNIFLPRRYGDIHRIDLSQQQRLSSAELLDILCDTHPDISYAVWQFLRVANSGWKVTAKNLAGEPDTRGQKIVDDLISRLQSATNSGRFEESKSVDNLLNQLHLSIIKDGACAGETVLYENLRDVAEVVAPVDVNSIHFRHGEDGRNVPWQYQGLENGGHRRVESKLEEAWEAGYKRLDYPNFFYEALDPKIGDPYGRSPILPVLQVVFFQMQVLIDLKAAIHIIGYPRIEAKILEEVVSKNCPGSIKNDPNKYAEWLNNRLTELINLYGQLNPDDVMVHYDSVEMGMVGQNAKASFDIKSLIQILDHQMAASLKTLMTILGRKEGSTETYVSTDIMLYAKGVEDVQKVSEALLERAFTFCLNLQGFQGTADFEFDAIDFRSDEQREKDFGSKINNQLLLIAMGGEDWKSAVMNLTGKSPVDDPDIELLLKLLGKGSTGGGSSGTGNDNEGDSGDDTGDEESANN